MCLNYLILSLNIKTALHALKPVLFTAKQSVFLWSLAFINALKNAIHLYPYDRFVKYLKHDFRLRCRCLFMEDYSQEVGLNSSWYLQQTICVFLNSTWSLEIKKNE